MLATGILVICTLVTVTHNNSRELLEELKNQYNLCRIANPATSEADLLTAIEALGPVSEAPCFWTNIVNDRGFSEVHRGHCLIQLFERHVHPGMTLDQLASIVSGASWLDQSKIGCFIYICGYIPVNVNFAKERAFSIRVFPEGGRNEHKCVYITAPNTLNPDDLLRILHGEPIDTKLKSLIISDSWPRRRGDEERSKWSK